MGIERFFGTLNKIDFLKSAFNELAHNLDTSYLLIDFNSIIHVKSANVIDKLNSIFYKHITRTITSELDIFNKKYDINIDNIVDIKEEILNKIVLKSVINHTYKIIKKFVNSSKLKYLYIAIDGVPIKGKIMEQKNRQYIAAISGEMSKHIFEANAKNLDEKRVHYEKNKHHWSKNNIKPGTTFMTELEKELRSNTFINHIKSICINLQEYILSDSHYPAEGERKIINYLKNRSFKERSQKNNNVVIYSPDNDMQILALLLNVNVGKDNKVSGIKLIKHDQQKNKHDVIDIDVLSNCLFTFVKNNTELQINIDNIVIDLCFLFNFFGNDFVAKIESCNVSSDFVILLKKYCELLKKFTKNDIVQYITIRDNNTNKVYIDENMFINMIEILSLDEHEGMQRNYLYNTYLNVNKLLEIFSTDQENILKNIKKFYEKFNDFVLAIKNNKNIDKYIDNEKFIKILQKLIKFDKQLVQKNVVDKVKEYFNKYQKSPKLDLNLIKRDKKTTKYVTNKIKETLNRIDKSIKLSKYDIELYAMNNLLDNFVNKFNGESPEIGKIMFNGTEITQNNHDDDVKLYYKTFFNIKNINVNNDNMQNLIYDYIESLVWVFDYYNNNYDDDELEHSNIWYYNHNRAPLFSHIYEFLKQNPGIIRKIFKDLQKFKIDRQNYFTEIEQILYVNPPTNNTFFLPIEFRSFYKDNINIYPNLTDEIKSTIKNKSKLIDCINNSFLTKCHVHNIDLAVSDKEFINIVRKVKDTVNLNYKLFCHKFDVTPNNSSKLNLKRITDKNYYKQKYNETRIYNYKILYKWIKHYE